MTFLLLNQTFHPDVMATGQYLTEVALRLVERGHEVTVVTSRRAYDHPETRFPRFEIWRGIRIHRVGSTGFGKTAKWRRAADFASFLFLCALRLAVLPRHDVVVALTSPPLIAFLGAWLAKLRRSRFVYWVMDFNPDEAIAAGWLRRGSPAARMLDAMSRFSLKRASRIIALDRFMRERIIEKGIAADKVAVIPPWMHDGDVQFDAQGRARFRKAHGLEDKFVVMYSGNHSPCHPLDTLMRAAEQLRDERDIVFCFIGGGSEWRKLQSAVGQASRLPLSQRPSRLVEAQAARASATCDAGWSTSDVSPAQPSTHIKCLPYQPLSELSASLSAADLHVVVMGDVFVGLVHPCKIYNVLGVGAPVLCIGPRPSHLSEILDRLDGEYLCGTASHADPGRVVEHIHRVRLQVEVAARQRQAPPPALSEFSRETLLAKLVAKLEEPSHRSAPPE
jgi:colanic acid biosynthesis glycosyl transferase WcaI